MQVRGRASESPCRSGVSPRLSARFSPRRRAYHRTSFTSADASRLDAMHVKRHIRPIETLLASTPCMSQHIIRICGRFSPRRRARQASYHTYRNASGLDAVHVETHHTHLRTLLAWTPCAPSVISNIYKCLSLRRRAGRNTSYASADASRLDAVHAKRHVRPIETLLASTPCMSQHIIHICGRFSPRRRARPAS